MTANSTPTPGQLRRFTLLLSGEDVLDEPESKEGPRQGLPHERFLLG